jgi:hypothetical protein
LTTKAEFSRKIKELIELKNKEETHRMRSLMKKKINVGKTIQRLCCQLFIILVAFMSVWKSSIPHEANLKRHLDLYLDQVTLAATDIQTFSKINMLDDAVNFIRHILVKGIVENMPEAKEEYLIDQSPFWDEMFYMYYHSYYNYYYFQDWPLYSDWTYTEKNADNEDHSSSDESYGNRDEFVAFVMYASSEDAYPLLETSSDQLLWEYNDTDAEFNCPEYCDIDNRFCFGAEIYNVVYEDISEDLKTFGNQNFNLTSFIFRVTFHKDDYELPLMAIDQEQGYYFYERGTKSTMEDPFYRPENERESFIDNNDFIYIYDYQGSCNTSYEHGGFYFFVQGNKFEDMDQLTDFFYQFAMDMDVIPFLWLNWASF